MELCSDTCSRTRLGSPPFPLAPDLGPLREAVLSAGRRAAVVLRSRLLVDPGGVVLPSSRLGSSRRCESPQGSYGITIGFLKDSLGFLYDSYRIRKGFFRFPVGFLKDSYKISLGFLSIAASGLHNFLMTIFCFSCFYFASSLLQHFCCDPDIPAGNPVRTSSQ